MYIVRKIKEFIRDLKELDKAFEEASKYYDTERDRWIHESELLSPDYDYLKIDGNGRLRIGYPIPNAMSFTYDKVAAASYIYGYKKMDEMPELGWGAFMIGRNEIYERVGRERIFSDEKIQDTIERCNNDDRG